MLVLLRGKINMESKETHIREIPTYGKYLWDSLIFSKDTMIFGLV